MNAATPLGARGRSVMSLGSQAIATLKVGHASAALAGAELTAVLETGYVLACVLTNLLAVALFIRVGLFRCFEHCMVF